MKSLHLNPSWHKNRLIKVTERGLLALKSWRKRSYLTKGVVLVVIPTRMEIVQTNVSLTGLGESGNTEQSEDNGIPSKKGREYNYPRTSSSTAGSEALCTILEGQAYSIQVR